MKNQRLVQINFSIILFYLIYSIQANDLFDFRFVSYNESIENIQIYENNDQIFDAILLDERNDQIIIGAKNAIIRLSLKNFHLLERFLWESSINEMNICRNQIQTLNECENYIRVIALRPYDQALLTCGTNSYHPICIYRRANSLTTIIPTENIISGHGKSPYNSQYSSVYNLIETGELYSATRNEPIFGVNDPLIQRSFGQGKQLRTQQHDSNWLKDPFFIRILNIGQYIYTFFREFSLEHLSCGMNIYSRVARICKSDQGTMKFSDTFRSFSKLRLLCSSKYFNEINSFEFNQLESIYFHSSSNMIYAGFNLPKSGLIGSAICIYTIDQLESAFQTPFLVQKSNESYWLPSSIKTANEKCESNDIPLVSFGPVLRSGILQSTLDTIVLENIRIGHLLVDQLNDVTILFVITFDGLRLRKYSLLMNQKLCFLEEIPLKSPEILDQYWKINKAEFITKTKEILLTTDHSVLKIPVARCHRFHNSHLCSASMDPYCTWDYQYQRCSFSINSSSRYFHQSLTCPILNITIDGGWTSWSSWFICEQETGEKCQCRTRSCTQPKPQFNGKNCSGNSLQISNCQVHGGWSTWSSWSVCPDKCGKYFRYRTRTCTNPSPKNNGRLCIGSEQEEEPCSERICSNEWTICSKSCGSGIQKRICLTKKCLEETRLCNEFPCPIESMSLWSNWTRIKDDIDNDDMITETRTRFICSIKSDLSGQKLTIKSDLINYRICQKKDNKCYETDSLNQWSSWSNWTECNPSCEKSGSIQTRTRRCLKNECIGENIQHRNCLNCSMNIKTNWSCWSDWSDCSPCLPNQLTSIKIRTRTCLTLFCDGLSREERSCSCPSLIMSSDEYCFNYLHVILISFISFLFGCFMILCIYALCCHRIRQDQDYYRQSTVDSQTFSNLNSSSIRTNLGKYSQNEITTRKLNMYVNPRDIHSIVPPPPAATLKRTSLMSSMKTNLDADDL